MKGFFFLPQRVVVAAGMWLALFSSLLFSQSLEIHQINVGCGDSALIIHRDLDVVSKNIYAKKGKTYTLNPDKFTWVQTAIDEGVDIEDSVKSAVLIDAGLGWLETKPLVGYLKKYGVSVNNSKTKLTTFASHPHNDHVEGFWYLYEAMKPKEAYVSGFESDLTGQQYKNLLATHNITKKTATPDSAFVVDNGTPTIRFFHLASYGKVYNTDGNKKIKKQTTTVGDKVKKEDPNAHSIVSVLEYGNFRYFFGGDIAGDGGKEGGNQGAQIHPSHTPRPDLEEHIRKSMVFTYPKGAYQKRPGHVCAYKASHHGSAESNDVYTLSTLFPSVVAISSGIGYRIYDYPLPTQAGVNRLESPTWNYIDVSQTKPSKVVTNNSVQYSFITELRKSHGKSKSFPLKLDKNKTIVAGDILIRPYDSDVSASHSIRIRVDTSGSMENPTSEIEQAVKGTYTVTCSSH